MPSYKKRKSKLKLFIIILGAILISVLYPLFTDTFLGEWICYEAERRGELVEIYKQGDDLYKVYFLPHCKDIIEK